MFDALRMLYSYLASTEEIRDQEDEHRGIYKQSVKEVAAMIFQMHQETKDDKVTFEEFQELLAKDSKQEFPELRKMKKPLVKSKEELSDEAQKVKLMLEEMPPLPQKEDEVYHIVAMDWWLNWKAYTSYDQVASITPTGDDTASATLDGDDDQNGCNNELTKGHLNHH